MLTVSDAQLFASVTFKIYVPASASVAPETVGSALVETKPFGPVHAYVYGAAPPVAFELIVMSCVPEVQPNGS